MTEHKIINQSAKERMTSYFISSEEQIYQKGEKMFSLSLNEIFQKPQYSNTMARNRFVPSLVAGGWCWGPSSFIQNHRWEMD